MEPIKCPNCGDRVKRATCTILPREFTFEISEWSPDEIQEEYYPPDGDIYLPIDYSQPGSSQCDCGANLRLTFPKGKPIHVEVVGFWHKHGIVTPPEEQVTVA